MLGENQGGHLVIQRKDIAHLDAQNLQNTVGRRGYLHFRELRFNFSKLRLCQRDAFGARAFNEQIVTVFGGRGAFLQGPGVGNGSVAFGLGNGFLGKELKGAFEIGPGEFQFGLLRLPVVFRGLDFIGARTGLQFSQRGGGLIAACFKFGCVQLDNHLAGFKTVSFLREDFFDPSAITGGYVSFISLDGAGNNRRIRIATT